MTVHCETESAPVTIASSFVLLCAGARCDALRRAIGVGFHGASFDDRFLICDIHADLPGWAGERRFYFDPAWNPGRQVLIHPCPHDTFRIDWQVSADYDLDAEQASGALDRRIRAVIGDRAYRLVWRSVYRFHSRVVDRMRVGRILLAGDCAHLFAPFGARGLNSGVQDVENAAWKLAWVLRGWADPRLLDTYDLERRAAALENLDVTTRTMEFLAPRSEEHRLRRTAVLDRALTDPAAWPGVDSGRLAEPFWYVDSPLTSPDPSRPFMGRPPRGKLPPPGPGVLIPDAPIDMANARRVREICRDGILLLSGRAIDTKALEAAAAPARVVAMPEASPDGSLAESLGAKTHEVWLVRPDAHVAAVLDRPDAESLTRAIRRVLGRRSS